MGNLGEGFLLGDKCGLFVRLVRSGSIGVVSEVSVRAFGFGCTTCTVVPCQLDICLQSMFGGGGGGNQQQQQESYCVVMRAGTQEGMSESSQDQGSVLLLSATMTEDTVYPYTKDIL